MAEVATGRGGPGNTGQEQGCGTPVMPVNQVPAPAVPSFSKTPFLDKYTNPVKRSPREIVGRKNEMIMLEACLNRPELCNAMLLGDAGSGKTMLVQGLMAKDTKRVYLEVNLAKMIADFDPITLGNSLTQLFAEVGIKRAETGKEVVLFIDEFHQIVQLSAAAVEAMKPLLADSGTRGIKVIAATTFIEFRQYIAPNQPLVERLQRINLSPPGKDMTVSILKGVARAYGVDTQFYNDSMYEAIYETTQRYVPANSQPRKSILVMDAMVGYHRATGRPLDRKLLADVIYESEGLNISFRVDAANIKKTLDKYVYAQELATTLVTNRLHIAVADLNDKSRPMASFLFCGATGTGKGVVDNEMIPVYTLDGSVAKKRNGDLVVGDYVFNRKGEPVLVTGVYHRGMKDVYKVTLGDGRSIVVDGSHLWTWKYARGHESESFVTTNTEDLIRRGLYRNERNGRKSAKIWIPVNEAVQYPERELPVDPYVLGALLGNGCLTLEYGLVLSSGNRFVPDKVAERLGALEAKQTEKNYNWQFVKERVMGPRGGIRNRMIQRDDVLAGVPELIGLRSHEKFIPDDYKYGSVEQRWELIRGLFDTDGSIGQFDGDRFNVSYSTTSYQLAVDIQDVLFSLGIASTVKNHGDRGRSGDVHDEYALHVKVENDRKHLFFTHPKKLGLALKARGVAKTRYKTFDVVPIVSIEKLPEQQPTTCIMVEDDEHLYQAGQFIVTHNTELSKTIASVLFGESRDDGDENQSSNRNLIRLDMTEYAHKDSMERFRAEITSRIWEHPYSVVLLDEIEKACAEVTRMLLQVLDDGRLTDENGRQVVFTNCYIIMTTNAGSEIFRTIGQYNQSDTGDGAAIKRYNKLIRQSITQTTGENRFPPELLGRIDAIVPFQPLSEATMRRIVTSKLQKLIKEVSKKHGVELRVDKRLVDYLVLDNLDTDANSGGARIVMTKLTEEVTTPVAKFINENPDVRIIGVEVSGTMAWEDKSILQSEAYVRVAAAV